MGHDWDSLVGDQAASQMEFFRLETVLGFLERLWSQEATPSMMAREEDTAKSKRLVSGWYLVAALPHLWKVGTHVLRIPPERVQAQWLPSVGGLSSGSQPVG